MQLLLVVLMILHHLSSALSSDYPPFSRCTHLEFPTGRWTFVLTRSDMTRMSIKDCQPTLPLPDRNSTKMIELSLPNIAVDVATGTKGTWTFVYIYGIEIRVGDFSGIAYFKVDQRPSSNVSLCNETWVGWYHKKTSSLDPSEWGYGCFTTSIDKPSPTPTRPPALSSVNGGGPHHHQFGSTKDDLEAVATQMTITAKSQPPTTITTDDLPKSFDWRSVGGVNFVSPVGDQKHGVCGSCYAFATAHMYESQARIRSKNRYQPSFSEQEVVNCAQHRGCWGCKGGFCLLVSRFIQEWGIVPSECVPYVHKDGNCSDPTSCPSPGQFVKDYYYVGGYFGAANEANMMREIHEVGPIAVNFLIPGTWFLNYTHGIVKCPEVPEYLISHAVLLVGWGVRGFLGFKTKYWIAKNSWGEKWGDHGYFLIRRGQNDCNVETVVSSGVLRSLNF